MEKRIFFGIAATGCWSFSNVATKILLALFEFLSLRFSKNLVYLESIVLDVLCLAGLKVSFGDNCDHSAAFDSSSIEHRLKDFHESFADKTIACVLTAIGGFNSNQLLPYIDWDLVRENPKIFCGYSDITDYVINWFPTGSQLLYVFTVFYRIKDPLYIVAADSFINDSR